MRFYPDAGTDVGMTSLYRARPIFNKPVNPVSRKAAKHAKIAKKSKDLSGEEASLVAQTAHSDYPRRLNGMGSRGMDEGQP